MITCTHSAYPGVEWGWQGVTTPWCTTQYPDICCIAWLRLNLHPKLIALFMLLTFPCDHELGRGGWQ